MASNGENADQQQAEQPTDGAPDTERQGDDTGVVSLAEDLSIRGVTALVESLTTSLDGGGPLAIDGSNVKVVDSAGLQALAAFVNAAIARSIDVSWQAESEALQSAAAATGLEETLFRISAAVDQADDDLCPVF